MSFLLRTDRSTRTSMPVGDPRLTRAALVSLDAVNRGRYQIAGTVKNTPSSPVYRKVTLFDQVSRLLIQEQWSHPVTGAYRFKNLRRGVFFVVSVDHTGNYNAVIADRLVPELMP